MNEAEKLLEKFARNNMVQWNQESFKRTHSRLHKSIIEAINEALNLHNVVVPKGTLCCEPKDYKMLDTGSVICKVCKKTIAI